MSILLWEKPRALTAVASVHCANSAQPQPTHLCFCCSDGARTYLFTQYRWLTLWAVVMFGIISALLRTDAYPMDGVSAQCGDSVQRVLYARRQLHRYPGAWRGCRACPTPESLPACLPRRPPQVYTALCFLLGSFLSATAGYIGMAIATQANSRTAEACKTSMTRGLQVGD